MRKNWLIISYFAHIDALAPSHHIDDRLRVLAGRELEIHLLSSPCGARYSEFSHMRIPSPAPSGIRYEVRHFLRRKTKKRFWFKFWETLLLLPVFPFYFLEKIFLRLDSTWSWCISSTFAAVFLSFRHKPEIIYSTGGPVSAHIAALIASAVTGVPHIAEFQDPLVHNYAAPRKCERYYMEKIERAVFRTAQKVLFLTRQAAQNAAGRNPTGANAVAIYPGAFPLPMAAHQRTAEAFEIAHFGSLAGSRNLETFLKALGSLFAEQPDAIKLIRISLFGNNGRNVLRQIEEFPYHSALFVAGKIRRDDSVSSMLRADLLLLIQNTDDVSFETIPSKVYEYLHSGKPILGLVYRNAELQEMLESAGHTVVQADDTEAIKKALVSYIEHWRHKQKAANPLRSPYTVEAAVDILLSITNNIKK